VSRSFTTLTKFQLGDKMALFFCRERAAHCHRSAETAMRPEIRQAFEKLERQWTYLAEYDDCHAIGGDRHLTDSKALG
jgi:hypothetical protein